MSERNDTPAADDAKSATADAKAQANVDVKAQPKAQTKPETPSDAKESEIPRAAQLSDAPKPEAKKSEAPRIANLPVLHKPQPKEKQGRRFALLAATVALAACGGAIAGSLGIASVERAFAPEPAAQPVVNATPDQTSAEIKALKEQVAQLRVTARQLSDSLAAARTTMGQSNAATAGQLTKIAETVERIEKNERKEAERRAQAPAPAPQPAAAPQQHATAPAADVTGSIAPPAPAAAPVRPIVPGWTLRRVIDGGALVAGPLGLIEIEPGERIPGLGKIEDVRREDGRWVVVTQKGLIVPR